MIDLTLPSEILFLSIVLATFILEDPTTLTVSLLIKSSDLSPELGLSALALGIFLGDLGLYFLGLGIQRGIFKKRKEFLRPSFFSVAVARFVPGMRTITFSSAGFNRLPIKKFLLVILPSSVIWTLLIFKFSEQILFQWRDFPLWVSLCIGLSVFIGLNFIVKYFTRNFLSTSNE